VPIPARKGPGDLDRLGRGAQGGAFDEPVHPLGHAPVRPQPLVLTNATEPRPPMPWANDREAVPAASPAGVTRLPAPTEYGGKPRGKLAKMFRFMQLFGQRT